MAVMTGGKVMEGGYDYVLAGAPGAGTTEVQTLTIDADGGTFKLAFNGYTTGAITWSATNNTLRDNVDAALEALPSIGTGGITTAVGTMTAGVGTLTLTFAGDNVKQAQPLITVADDSLTGTGAAVSVAETTPGVDASPFRPGVGAIVKDVTNAFLYINTGTSLSPTWTKVGAQS